MVLIVIRLGMAVTLPGVKHLQLNQLNQYGLLNLIGLTSGDGLTTVSFFALGVSPYISASITVYISKYHCANAPNGSIKKNNSLVKTR